MKLILDLRRLVKVFSILASTESLILTKIVFSLSLSFNGMQIMHFPDIIGKLGSNPI